MTPEERRQAIIEIGLPMLLEHGPNVSTRQIAAAAGIAEGTIFRVFATKQDLVEAVVRHALDADDVITGLDGLDATRPLHDQVADVLRILIEEMVRTRALALLLTYAHTGERAAPWRPHHPPHVPERMNAIRTAVERALRPYAGQLAVDPHGAAGLLFALAFTAQLPLAPLPTDDPAELASLVLNGLAKGDSWSAC